MAALPWSSIQWVGLREAYIRYMSSVLWAYLYLFCPVDWIFVYPTESRMSMALIEIIDTDLSQSAESYSTHWLQLVINVVITCQWFSPPHLSLSLSLSHTHTHTRDTVQHHSLTMTFFPCSCVFWLTSCKTASSKWAEWSSYDFMTTSRNISEKWINTVKQYFHRVKHTKG